MVRIYVGNLSFQSSESELKDLFGEFGQVQSVSVVTDRATGQPRGFAFVEMTDGAAATAAIQGLDGREFGGRNLRVNEAKERESGGGGGRPPRR